MKKNLSDIGSSHIWDAVFCLQVRKKVDLSVFSAEERKEIEKYLEIIKAIEVSQESIPVPSKISFNKMLLSLPEENVSRKGGWGHFFSKLRGDARQWMAIPAFGLLALSFVMWSSQKTEIRVVAAEQLSEEIQNDFQEMYRDIEEIELLKKELDLVYLDEEKSSLYF